MTPPEPLWYNHRIPGLNSSVLGDDPGTLPMALLQEDIWVGKAITDARVAYESWIGLLNGEIRIEPEHCPGAVCGPYANVFANYAKAAFLGAVAVPYRGFFEFKNGVLVKTEDVYYRMREMVSGEQLDEFLKLTAPLRNLRNKDQHREEHPPVWSILPRPSPPLIGIFGKGFVDPLPIYELLRSLEPAIGWTAFVKSGIDATSKAAPPPDPNCSTNAPG